jgi:hypothetical protein
MYVAIVDALEANETLDTAVRREPQLGKRGLHPTLGSGRERVNDTTWLLNLCDRRPRDAAAGERFVPPPPGQCYARRHQVPRARD